MRDRVQVAATKQRGMTVMGMLMVAIAVAMIALIGMKVFPTVNEYWTILRAINKIANDNPSSVDEARRSFNRQKEIEYSIQSIDGKDLVVTKEVDRVVISFAYDKEIELMAPVFLLIKYEGRSTPGRSR